MFPCVAEPGRVCAVGSQRYPVAVPEEFCQPWLKRVATTEWRVHHLPQGDPVLQGRKESGHGQPKAKPPHDIDYLKTTGIRKSILFLPAVDAANDPGCH
jgi:hypothetical protein